MSDEAGAWEEVPDTGTNRKKISVSHGMTKDKLFVEERRSGHYKCKAQNSYGNSSDTVLVLVLGKCIKLRMIKSWVPF